jgi:xanthosine utilization system XapX-like protein
MGISSRQSLRLDFAASAKRGAAMTGIRWLGLLPFLGILVGTAFVNQVEPLFFGMPFVLAWLVAWVIAGSIITAIIYKFDPVNAQSAREHDETGR